MTSHRWPRSTSYLLFWLSGVKNEHYLFKFNFSAGSLVVHSAFFSFINNANIKNVFKKIKIIIFYSLFRSFEFFFLISILSFRIWSSESVKTSKFNWHVTHTPLSINGIANNSPGGIGWATFPSRTTKLWKKLGLAQESTVRSGFGLVSNFQF